MAFVHQPVLLKDILSVCPLNAKLYLDFTLGGGGHAEALLAQYPGLKLMGSDRDSAAIDAARKKLAPFGERARASCGDMAAQVQAYVSMGLKADFLLADLGVSSAQLDQAGRGFSFAHDGPLDMRMDRGEGVSAADYLQDVSLKELTQVLYEYGEESFAPKIAAAIVRERLKKQLTGTRELAELVYQVIPRRLHPKRIHPATKTFQAIRIQVNDEMGQLKSFLQDAKHLLNLGGRIAIISFHSLEDRPVKQAFLKWEKPCTCPPTAPICQCGLKSIGVRVTKKPIRALEAETQGNPRARSAKLRVFEKQ